MTVLPEGDRVRLGSGEPSDRHVRRAAQRRRAAVRPRRRSRARRYRRTARCSRELLDDPYFRRPPPKTTGREEFGAPFVARWRARARRAAVRRRRRDADGAHGAQRRRRLARSGAADDAADRERRRRAQPGVDGRSARGAPRGRAWQTPANSASTPTRKKRSRSPCSAMHAARAGCGTAARHRRARAARLGRDRAARPRVAARTSSRGGWGRHDAVKTDRGWWWGRHCCGGDALQRILRFRSLGAPFVSPSGFATPQRPPQHVAPTTRHGGLNASC